MASTQIRGFHCPFRGFHCFPDGKEESKGVSRMVPHLKALHLCTDERKSTFRKAFKSDCDLFMVLKESLRMVAQWMFGKCMSFHVMSHTYHHHYGLVCVTAEAGEVRSYVVQILKPSRKDHDTCKRGIGLRC